MKLSCVAAVWAIALASCLAAPANLRVMIETDAGGDPDDEQSFVRFLLYANEWDIEGIIANRPATRRPENRSPENTGLAIVHRLIDAYGQCWSNLVQHDARFPTRDFLRQRTVAGGNDTEAAVRLILAEADKHDPRPIWYSDWGTDHGAATNNLRRALDLVLRERGPGGYAEFKSKIRLSSANAFGDHLANIDPPFKIWVNTFEPPVDGKRWYHRFSGITSRAGGFDLVRDVLTGHGPLGALYPTNTTHWAKEGDTMTFLYLVPTGMNDPNEPGWGSWGGRYGRNPIFDGKPYYWADQIDSWQNTKHRDNTLTRWAVDLQNDFRARLEWCIKPRNEANHPPSVVVNGTSDKSVLRLKAHPGSAVNLDASESSDPDGDKFAFEWFLYPEAGTYDGRVILSAASTGSETPLNSGSALVREPKARLLVPQDATNKQIHVVLTLRDNGSPALAAYRRVVIDVGAN